MTYQRIFLATTSHDQQDLHEELLFTLENAGFEVVSPAPLHTDSLTGWLDSLSQQIKICSASIHILGKEHGKPLPNSYKTEVSVQLELALNTSSNSGPFRVFVWNPVDSTEVSDPKQISFVSEVQNAISANMTYTNTPNSLRFAEDIRSILEVSSKPELNLPETEVFFISNMIDDEPASEITDMLSDVTKVQTLIIEQNQSQDFAELSSQQIQKSKLAVIYFKNSSDWAIPFAQQIWKKIGGASAPAPILLIGDEDPESNRGKGFNAPKVTSMVISGDLIPLEIKMHFDKVVE